MTTSTRVRVVSCYKGLKIYQTIDRFANRSNRTEALELGYFTKEASQTAEEITPKSPVDQPKQTLSGLHRMSLT